MKKLILLFVSCCTLLFTTLSHAKEAQLQSGLIIPVARDLKPFILYDAKGQQFTNENLKGHWTLLFFGFTNCPALCPTSMAQLNSADKNFHTLKVDPVPQVVFVSVDPERDTAAKVNTFATTFNKSFIGLRTDDMATLNQMTHEMNSMFMKVKINDSNKDKDNKANYTIDHTGDIMVINPQGQLVAMLTMPHTALNITADYQTILKTVK